MISCSDQVEPPCIKTIEKIIGKSILRLGKVSRAAVEILTGLARMPMEGGTLCVSSDTRTKKVTLLYNPLFIKIMYSIDPSIIELLLLHELAHILLLHFTILRKNSSVMTELLTIYTKDEITSAVDVLANFFVYLKNYKATKCGVPILCPVCAEANSLSDYLVEARNKMNSRSFIGRQMYTPIVAEGETISPNYLIQFISNNIPRFECSACLCSYYAYSNPYLEYDMLSPLSALLIESSSKNAASSIAAICEYLRHLDKHHTRDKEFDVYEALLKKYGKIDADIIYKSMYSSSQRPSSFIDLSDEANSREVEYSIKDKINKAVSKESSKAGKSSLYSPIEIDSLMQESKIKWDKYLRQSICTSVSIDSTPSRLRRNRRFGFTYPGYKKRETTEIMIALDVSGSMPSSLISKIKSNMLSLKEKIDINCTVVEFDTKVVSTYPIDKLTNVRSSFGGTVLSAPIEWAIKENLKKGSLIFIFTDGMGPSSIKEELKSEVNKYKYTWMLTGTYTNDIDRFCGKHSKIVEVSL